MATFGVYTVTGQGSQSLGGAQNLIYINTWISVLGPAQVITLTGPKRIMHAGWWALGYSGGVFPSSPPAILKFKYFQFESESIVFATAGGSPVNANTLYWNLPAGVTAKFFLST
jgi:hypothetical protein